MLFSFNSLLRSLRGVSVAFAAVLLVFAAGCSSDSPTEPTPDGNGLNPNVGNNGTWTITVTASPNNLPSGPGASTQVEVSVRRTSDGSRPADNTTLTLSTNLGLFNSEDPTVGSQSVALTLVGGQASARLFSGSSGTASLVARLEGSVGRATVRFSGTDTFIVESISPATSAPGGGGTATIRGSGFIEPVQVLFGGVQAEVLNVSSTRIRTRIPPTVEELASNEVAVVDVAVTIQHGSANAPTDVLEQVFRYTRGGIEGFQVFAITPATGPNDGGTQVTIRGSGFQAPVQVVFEEAEFPDSVANEIELEIVSVSSSEIVAITPAATGFAQAFANEDVNVIVRNTSTGAAGILESAFRYGVNMFVTGLEPNSGPPEGGTNVTIFGQGFDDPLQVLMGNTQWQVISVTGTEIIARSPGLPAGTCTGSGSLLVRNLSNGSTAESPIFTYVADDASITLNSLSPTSVAQGGGAVTASGENLNLTGSVTVGGSNAAITSQSSTSLVFQSPSFPDTALDTQTCTAGGESGEQYIATLVDVEFINNDACGAGAMSTLTIQPSDPSCRVTASATCSGASGGPSCPVPSFTFTQDLGNPAIVNFTDTSSNTTSWSWSFGDGGTSTDQNPTHTYAGSGSYSVVLEACNTNGCVTSSPQTVTVP